MSTIADLWKAYLTGEGYTFSSVQDTIRQALLVETGRSTGSIQELWKAYLIAEGYDGAVPDMMKKWLEAKGYDGSVQDMLKKALRDGDIFAAAAAACIFTLQGDLGAFGLTTFPTISDKTVSVTADGTSNYGASSGIAGIPVDWADKRIAEFDILTFTAADTTQEPTFQMLRPSDNDLVQALWNQSLGQWIFTIVDNGSVTLGQINVTGAVTDKIAIGIDGSNGDAFITRNGATAVTKATVADSGTFAGLGALFASQNAVIITQLRNAAASTAYSARINTSGADMQSVYDDTAVNDWCGQDTVESVLLYDNFTESLTTSIVSHTPDVVVSPAATPWAQNGTHFRVNTSGLLEIASASAADRQCYINGGSADGIVSMTSLMVGSGLMFRHADTSNYWVAFNRNAGATNVELYEITAGVLTTRGTYNVGSFATRKIQSLCSGTSIDIYIDGALRISYTSSAHQTATGVGVRSEAGAGSDGVNVADKLRVIQSTSAAALP